MMKTIYDIDVTDRTSVVYAENKIELSWLIGWGVVCDENQIGQWHDRSYKWHVYVEYKTELSW